MPCTRMEIRSSETRTMRSTVASVPTPCSSAAVGSSTPPSFCVTTAMVRSPAITSFNSATLRGRPMLNGRNANGKSTVCRTGSTGTSRTGGWGPSLMAGNARTPVFFLLSRGGMRVPFAPRVRGGKLAGLLVLNRDLGRSRSRHRLEMDLEHPVPVAGLDHALVRLPRQLDQALELAEIDLGAVIVRVARLLRRIAPPAHLERAAAQDHAHALPRHARQLEQHARRVPRHHQVGGGLPGRLAEVGSRVAMVDEIVEQALDFALDALDGIFGITGHHGTPQLGRAAQA